MSPPVHLVPDNISHDTVKAISELHEDAAKGDLIGIGFVCIYTGQRVIANVAGECYHNPRFTRALLLDLDDKLQRRLSQEGGDL